ncbi:MAG: NrdH-redoxin [Bacteriovoracaceae bacterium]|jgi:glutaredoxin 3|nr:NrdH-redoxin [Bacteriovoracaceae bacterium]
MKLELFYFNSCPFCQYVLEVLQNLDIKVDMLDIHENQENLTRLMADTRRKTVPCLYIDNQPMFESTDIINWLQANKSKLPLNN